MTNCQPMTRRPGSLSGCKPRSVHHKHLPPPHQAGKTPVLTPNHTEKVPPRLLPRRGLHGKGNEMTIPKGKARTTPKAREKIKPKAKAKSKLKVKAKPKAKIFPSEVGKKRKETSCNFVLYISHCSSYYIQFMYSIRAVFSFRHRQSSSLLYYDGQRCLFAACIFVRENIKRYISKAVGYHLQEFND